jgi:BirA family biotin operon repressor/biotin-[acetyl-CoA-carboxylase] ligase
VTLGAAVAVRRAVARASGVEAALKWPNDLEVGGAKLCGILGEVVAEKAIALGIGLNVHEAPPVEEIGRPAIALDQAAGRPVARNPLAALLLADLEQVLDDIRSGHDAQLLAAWRDGCNHLGQRVRIMTGAEPETGDAIGVAVDIDAAGALLLRRDDGKVVEVVAGSLEMVGPSP